MSGDSTRATKSGLAAEAQKKLEASYSKEAEAQVRAWLEEMVGEEIGSDFFADMKDGTYLCKLILALEPGIIPNKYTRPTRTPFQQMEAINVFINGCKTYGVSEKDLFVTLDLFERTNPNMVISGIQALGRQATKKGHDTGNLFPKEADKNVRSFSEDQLKQGEAVIGLQAGSNKGASQSGMTFGQQRQIHKT